jgi:hypothetical protein
VEDEELLLIEGSATSNLLQSWLILQPRLRHIRQHLNIEHFLTEEASTHPTESLAVEEQKHFF